MWLKVLKKGDTIVGAISDRRVIGMEQSAATLAKFRRHDALLLDQTARHESLGDGLRIGLRHLGVFAYGRGKLRELHTGRVASSSVAGQTFAPLGCVSVCNLTWLESTKWTLYVGLADESGHRCGAAIESKISRGFFNPAVAVWAYLRIGYDGFEITACWAQVSAPGAGQGMASHPNNFLSGVYCVQSQAGADTINFHEPRNQTSIIRPPVTELTAENTDQVVVKVTDGTLLIFPSWLQHSVDANASDGESISIGFNIMFAAYGETMGRPLWEVE